MEIHFGFQCIQSSQHFERGKTNMIPSTLVLQVGVIQKYNNDIVIADGSREIGENEDINPLDSASAVNLKDSATPLYSAQEQHSTHISPAEIGAGIAFVVFILFLALSS